ncbi:MAG: sugar-binding protein, partial [Chloroflexota bacterium]
GKKVVVQCKRYAGNVGQPVVRDLYGAMFHVAATEAHVCTTGRLSRQAEQWAAGKPIELIDGNDMVAWASKWRRQESERQGANIIWTTAGALMIGTMVIAAIALVAGGWFFFNQRTLRPTATPVLVIPVLPTVTPEGGVAIVDPVPTETSDEEPVETETEESPQLVPTSTLPAIPTESVPVTSGTNVDVPRRTQDLKIDGLIEEWSSPVAESSFTVYADANWDNTDDLEATWYLSWDEGALYLAIRVVDDTHAQFSTGAFTYLGDSLEIQLDTDRSGDFGEGVSADEFQLEISPGNFADLGPEAWRFRGTNSNSYVDAPGHQIVVGSQQTAEGYTIEARIPWNNINVTPAEGFVLGANLNVNDNDTNGPLQELMKSNISSRTYRNPTTWGTLTLKN